MWNASETTLREKLSALYSWVIKEEKFKINDLIFYVKNLWKRAN